MLRRPLNIERISISQGIENKALDSHTYPDAIITNPAKSNNNLGVDAEGNFSLLPKLQDSEKKKNCQFNPIY